MAKVKAIKRIRKAIAWSLLAVTLLYVITGLGITEYRAIELFTGGLLSKSLSFTIHLNLLVPFSVLLTIHILFRFVVG